MALLFCDSFSGYATADLPTRWVGADQNVSIVNTPLPPNSQAGAQVLFNNGGFAVNNNFGSNARMVMGCRYYRFSTFAIGYVMGFASPTGVGSWLTPCHIKMDGSGTTIWSGDSGSEILLATGPVIPAQEWHHLELDATFGLAGTATIHLYVDGDTTPFLSAVGVSTLTATASTCFLGQPPSAVSGANAAGYFADFYLLNGVGADARFNSAFAPQGFGAPKVAFAIPTAPGAASDWTPNGAATIWESIDQIPQDGDTTYASDATPGDQYQVVFGSLPPMQTLLAVQLSTYARTDDAGPRAYQSGFWKGGVFGYSGHDQFLGGTYNYIEDEFMTNPVTGLAWAPADLTGLQFGAKLTV